MTQVCVWAALRGSGEIPPSQDLGYAPDFVLASMAPYLKEIKSKGIRVISNAGGVNPLSCSKALQDAADKVGVKLNIATVTGDDLLPRKDRLVDAEIKDMNSGLSLPPTTNSINAYLGAGAIVRALELGADVVISGRCVDSALVLAPLVYKFNWSYTDYHKLAAGSLAGHLVECGAQVTGGIFTDWYKVPDWHNIGFPVVEVFQDGRILVDKPRDTGGLITCATVSEQLLYEIGDPRRYLLPDVTCDWAEVKLMQIDDNLVQALGAKGLPPTDKYKISATYADGYRMTAVANVAGGRAVEKGRKTAEAILARTRAIFKQLKLPDYSDVNLQLIGSDSVYASDEHRNDAREVVMWLAVTHSDKRALDILAREIAPAGTGMAPGLTGIVGGRPKASPVFKFFSFLHPKSEFNIQIHMNGDLVDSYSPHEHDEIPEVTSSEQKSGETLTFLPGEKGRKCRLEELVYTRSGDKGNNANIGVIAREERYIPYLRGALTAEALEQYFSHLFQDRSGPLETRVERFEVPGIGGFNFLLKNALGGGGIASLRSDPQGKALGQMLLDMQIDIPENL